MLAPDGNYCPNSLVEVLGKESGMQVSPNPCSDELHLHLVNAGEVSLYSADGFLVMREYLKKGDNNIDVSSLSSGLYYLVMGESRESLLVE